MLACKTLTAFPVILYPAEFIVKLWIENKNVTCVFDNFLQSRAGALKIFLRR